MNNETFCVSKYEFPFFELFNLNTIYLIIDNIKIRYDINVYRI